MPWASFMLDPFPELFRNPGIDVRVKVKDAVLRKGLDARQLDVAYEYLSTVDNPGAGFGFATYGGRMNAVATDATASAHRAGVIMMAPSAGWIDPNDDEKNLAWARRFYRDLFAETGGVPAPSEAVEGSIINHPDSDLADPAWNTSSTS